MKRAIKNLILFFLIGIQPLFAQWSELGGLNGLAANTWIISVCSDAPGNIYASGNFTNSSGNRYVAKYNGSAWSELGGLNGLAANDWIESVCSDALGNIYVGGWFTNSSGKYYVAKYDGTTWSELGGLNGLGVNNVIWSVYSDASGNIYAAGNFTNSSGNRYVAKYDGTTWSELGGLDGLAAHSTIYSVSSDTLGNIYAGGWFTNSLGHEYVAKYDGTAWSEMGGLNGLAANYIIFSVYSDATGNIYAAGQFLNSSGNEYVAKYNGSAWSELGGLNGLAANSGIGSVFSDASGNIYAAGGFTNSSGNWYVAKYNGTAWSELGGLNGLAANGGIGSACSDSHGNIYATGNFSNSSGNRYVAEYDTNCSTSSAINPIACGSYTSPGGNYTWISSGIYMDTIPNAAGCDSVITINLTINLLPVALYTIYPSPTPHNWYAVNQCTGTPPLSYVWNWGDSSAVSTGATPSHTYADSGYYNVCVTVTDGNGCVKTYCDSTTYIYKGNSNSPVTINVVMSLPSGVEDIDGGAAINIFPNPVSDVLNISFNKSLAVNAIISISDMQGRMIKEKKISQSNSGVIPINVSALSPGVYLLKVNENMNRFVKM